METNPMMPKKGATSLLLPITFDYSGGRSESMKSRYIWSAILGVIVIIIAVGVATNKSGFFAFNLILAMGILFVSSYAIRMLLLKEGKLREDFKSVNKNDMKRGFEDSWGIYSVDEDYPYYCRYRNGKSGLIIQLNKDVILGKYSDSEYEHYEAISDAYNIAGSSNIQMCYVDSMGNVGTDSRLEQSFAELSSVNNPDVRDVLTDIFTYQKNLMMERVTTTDHYVFTWRGSDITAWNIIQQILACFLQANYVSYHILDPDDMRDLYKDLFNVHEFSVVDATLSAFNAKKLEKGEIEYSFNGVTPIRLVYEDGTETKLGKTREEKEQERKLAEKEKELKKQELKRRKSKSSKKPSKKSPKGGSGSSSEHIILDADEILDLF